MVILVAVMTQEEGGKQLQSVLDCEESVLDCEVVFQTLLVAKEGCD